METKREVERIKEFLEYQAEISESEQRLQMEVAANVEQTQGEHINPAIPAQIVASLLLQQPRDQIEAYFNKIQEVAPEFGELVAQAMDQMLSGTSTEQKQALENQANPLEKPEEEKIKGRD